jgi:hypothetical protein
MKIPNLIATVSLGATLLAAPAFAQDKAATPAAAAATSSAANAAPDMQQMMQQMMELAKLNENHKLLTSLNGTWGFTVKSWMDGDTSKKPEESKGTAVRKSLMDGRYVAMDVTGNMEMAGPDGKKKSMTFKGHGLEAYDNVKKKFVGTWVDNMGTGIMMSEGDYDEATKTFTYTGEIEPMPGMKQKIREVVKLDDKDHMTMEWYEDRQGKEMKTMEIDYARKK